MNVTLSSQEALVLLDVVSRQLGPLQANDEPTSVRLLRNVHAALFTGISDELAMFERDKQRLVRERIDQEMMRIAKRKETLETGDETLSEQPVGMTYL